jgi:hypothetical protein
VRVHIVFLRSVAFVFTRRVCLLMLRPCAGVRVHIVFLRSVAFVFTSKQKLGRTRPSLDTLVMSEIEVD